MALKNVKLYQIDRDIFITHFCARYLAKNSRVKVRILQELKVLSSCHLDCSFSDMTLATMAEMVDISEKL